MLHSFAGDVPGSGADEHQRAVAVRETADDARATPDLPVQPFDHVVRADPPAVLRREFRQKVGGRLLDALAQAAGRRLELPGLHLRGDRPGLGEGDSRDSMANIAFRAADAQSRWLGGTFESTLRMKCTMHRWYFARGSIEFTVETSPAHRSPTTRRTPFKPRSIMLRMNCSQLAASSSCPRHADDLPRVASRVDADGDEDADVLHLPPQERLCHTPVHEHVVFDSNGWAQHRSMSSYTRLSLSERVWDGILSPHSSLLYVDLNDAYSRQAHLHQRSSTLDPCLR